MSENSIFRRAREILQAPPNYPNKVDSWIKHDYSGPDGYCMIGACAKALGGVNLVISDFEDSEKYEVLKTAVVLAHGDSITPAQYNDLQATTLQDVLKVLEVAEEWEETHREDDDGE